MLSFVPFIKVFNGTNIVTEWYSWRYDDDEVMLGNIIISDGVWTGLDMIRCIEPNWLHLESVKIH